jgi:hypothetical protein
MDAGNLCTVVGSEGVTVDNLIEDENDPPSLYIDVDRTKLGSSKEVQGLFYAYDDDHDNATSYTFYCGKKQVEFSCPLKWNDTSSSNLISDQSITLKATLDYDCWV